MRIEFFYGSGNAKDQGFGCLSAATVSRFFRKGKHTPQSPMFYQAKVTQQKISPLDFLGKDNVNYPGT